jgi:predicted DNA binding CopG/RHH family protein
MATQRKPMTFDIDSGSEPASLAPASRKRIADVPAIKRQHIGARVPQDKYRQLKAHAVLTGIPVQALVEKIIDQYLASLQKQDRA